MHIIRTARDAHQYRKYLGEFEVDFGVGSRLILDMGAGDSTAAQELRQATACCIIRLDRDYAVNPPADRVAAVAGDAGKMPFADGTFDAAISVWMAPHLSRPAMAWALAEAFRVVKPGGSLRFFPCHRFGRVRVTYASRRWRGTLRLTPTLEITRPKVFRPYDLFELAGLLSLDGWHFRLRSWFCRITIQAAGTHRTIEKGSKTSLLHRTV